MRPAGHLRARVGALTIRAGLLALIALALPTLARAGTPASDPVAGVQPAVQFAEHAAGQLSSQVGADETVTPDLSTATAPHGGGGAAVPVVSPEPVVAPEPVSAPEPAPALAAIPDRVVAHAAASVQLPHAPVEPSPDPSAIAVALAVAHTDSAAPARPTPDVSPDAKPAGGTAPVASRGRTVSISTRPQSTAATLLDRQAQADNASASWPVRGASNPLSAVAALGPELQSLIALLEKSVRDGQPSAVVLGPSPQAAPSPQADAARSQPTSPDAAPLSKRLAEAGAPALPVAHLVIPDAQTSWGLGCAGRAGPVAIVTPPLPGLPQGSTQVAVAVAGHQRSGVRRRSSRANSAPVGSSITVAGAPPLPTPLPGGAAASGAIGGVGVGAAAAALLALAALWLLTALLPGRLTLDLFPWQSTMLALRLERPG